jgi:arabinogalactan endo-1,4-beta-galactosidase
MTRTLLLLILATAALAAGLFVLCQFTFSDVLAFPARNEDTGSWWRQMAFLTKAIAWISTELSGLFAIVLAALLWKQRSVKSL